MNNYAEIPPGRPDTNDELVRIYGPFVGYWAVRFANKVRSDRRLLDDIMQDGWLGALIAWSNYNQSCGCSFKTYATSMIRWAILNGARTADRNAGRLYVQNSKGRASPADYAVANAVSLDDDVLHGLQVTSANLDELLATESFQRLLDLIRSQRVRFVLDQYYRCERTLVDIGATLGVSRERVRQLLVQGVEVIRKKLSIQDKK